MDALGCCYFVPLSDMTLKNEENEEGNIKEGKMK